MNNKKGSKKTIEEKIYEHIGVVQFKKAAIAIQKGLRRWLDTDASNFKLFDNYFLTELNMKGLKKFRWQGILINFGIHFPALISSSMSLVSILSTAAYDYGELVGPSIGFALNAYCVMLQRYNYVRINRTIKTMQETLFQPKGVEIPKKAVELTKNKNLDFLKRGYREEVELLRSKRAQLISSYLIDKARESESDIRDLYSPITSTYNTSDDLVFLSDVGISLCKRK